MRSKEVVSHFWVAGQPYFSTTLLVMPPGAVDRAPQDRTPQTSDSAPDANGSAGERGASETVECVIYDLDGSKVNNVTVDFPASSVGVIELEPFMAGLKLENGLQHGQVEVTSRLGSRHSCRIVSQGSAICLGEPTPLRSRDSTFIPIQLSAQREQMLVLVNAGVEAGQITCRLFYGSRSPEWNIVVPPRGSKVVSLHDDLLATQDDSSWEKGTSQAYLRVTSRYQGPVSCFAIERVPGEDLSSDVYRSLSLA